MHAYANECAAQLGLEPFSESVFESWIDNKIFDGATPYGHSRGINPTWLYSDEARDQISLIVKLKAQGAKRNTQLLVCLWVFGREFEFNDIIEALKSEFSRITKRLARGPVWWKCHYDDLAKLSEAERAKLIARFPPLDPDLAAATGSVLSPPAMFEVALRAYWGPENEEMIPSIIVGDLARTFALPAGTFDSWKHSIPLNISGAFGLPGESANDGYEIFDQISADNVENARNTIWLNYFGLLAGKFIFSLFESSPNNKLAVAFGKAANSVLRPDWVIVTLGLFAISAFHSRTAKTRAVFPK